MKHTNNAVVYRHIRLDTNMPFYVGMGTDSYRPFDKNNRNKLWNDVVLKTDYRVDVLFEDLNYDLAVKKEHEFIMLYKRICNGGTLCNTNLGGSGGFAQRVIMTNDVLNADELGPQARGDKCSRSKLNKEQVLEIRELYSEGILSSLQLAKMFSVSKPSILYILHRKSWKHV